MAIPDDQYNREEEFRAYLGGEAPLPEGAPRNREEEWYMYLAGEGDEPVEAPRNRDEEWALWLKDHIGGDPLPEAEYYAFGGEPEPEPEPGAEGVGE